MQNDTLLTVHIAAKRLDVSVMTLYRKIQSGEIVAHNVGTRKRSRYRIKQSEIEEYLRKGKVF